MNAKIELLRNKIKTAYEESVRANCNSVKELLFDCVGLLAGLETEPEPVHRKNHKWDETDATVAFYLAKKYDDNKFKDDPITKQLLSVRPSLAVGSLQMAIQNFYSLMGKKKGLKSVSNLAMVVFKKYKNTALPKLEEHIRKLLFVGGEEAVKQRKYMKQLVARFGHDEELVITEYAKAETNGAVRRKRDINNMDSKNYARLLWLDGVAKGWL